MSINRKDVAVKVEKASKGNLDAKSAKFLERQFFAEVMGVYKCEHPNLCKLLAHSIDGPRRCLIYEYCPQGSIDDLLRPKPSKTAPMVYLTWAQRLSLAVDSARALTYLHGLSPPVVHRDIKSSNILITSQFRAKSKTNCVRDVDKLLHVFLWRRFVIVMA
jgi:serine/threonine protein kinase